MNDIIKMLIFLANQKLEAVASDEKEKALISKIIEKLEKMSEEEWRDEDIDRFNADIQEINEMLKISK